jgi:hypothetical protein
MGYLYVFLEGSDDERFFKWYFNKCYLHFITYACQKPSKINNYIRSINKLPSARYLFIGDSDNDSPKVAKDKILKRFPAVNRERVVIVQREIESWYLAGLEAAKCSKLNVKYYPYTNNISKEQFDSLIPKEYSSRINFMIEILKEYNLRLGRERNKSLDTFCSKNSR